MHDGLGSWLQSRRVTSPEKTALIVDDGRRVSYRELADDGDRLTTLLEEGGIRPGDRVAYLGENSPEFLVSLFACARLGAVFVPVNTRLAPPEMLHVLGDSRARALIHDPEFAERLAPLVSALGIPLVVETGAGATGGSPVPSGAIAGTGLDDPVAIVYTSGTTGRAKGAVLTHGNLTWASINSIVDYDLVSTDVALMISPLFHVAALGMGALPILLKGGTLVLEKRFDAARALQLIERHGVTMLSGVPTTFQLMADDPAWAATDLSSLTKLTCGGSAVPTRILRAFENRGLSFSQGYGMTEAAPGVTALPAGRTLDKQGSVGVPHFFTRVRITDGGGTAATPGAVGEIEIAGPNVFPGYLGLPDSSRAAFTDDGWFRTGDLGHLDADGFLFLSGRLKDLIISGGENIYPAEIENALSGIPGITAAAVIGVPDDRWGEVPLAVVTVADDADVDTEVVRAHLDGRVARYKIPKRVVVVDELPRTASGKVRTAELRIRYGAPASPLS
ncbi:MAG: p-hydroxycinnamoyl-CoA synthetase [Herbiconiux sp.]|uniref:acyl-CoA synthetase n=1 Tax=Herbiconiux sp. TaxID=1871186 RepID=UPI0012059A09|nr:long-chain fatty acid--CoA ligase [Herbiconiux sp.]TAJ48758.1 MAG: p-hydroxycinnamoyl-CoA synthetase [Herbiconiux sp.]